MREETRAEASGPVRWRRTPATAIALAGAAAFAVAGIAFSRPDVVAVGLPLALAFCWQLIARPRAESIRVALRAAPGDGAEVRSTVEVDAVSDWVQLAVDQGERRTALIDARPGEGVFEAKTVLRHSGPSEVLGVTARALAADGAWVTEAAPPARLIWCASPSTRRIAQLPLPPRLVGLHGAHEGARPGHGGDFRDIHSFAPGDELRRVDWRATARLARRPGELLVRRTHVLSDATVVIAMDTADELGEVVASWGASDPERSGVTSLDLAREAALSIAAASTQRGDRTAFHTLAPEGRTIRAGSGARHLALLRDAIAATGVGGDDARYRRSPVIAPGSVVFVLSTFFDGAAAALATGWRASGHTVVAVDVLPAPDPSRLTREQRLAMRGLLAERAEILAELGHAGVEVIVWSDAEVDIQLRLAAVRQQRMRVRR